MFDSLRYCSEMEIIIECREFFNKICFLKCESAMDIKANVNVIMRTNLFNV